MLRAKKKLAQLEKNYFLSFFPINFFFFVFFFRFLSIVCPNWIQKSNVFDKKKLQSLN